MKIHGHRGARGYRPENTLPAVEYALQHGAAGVEVDICASGDDALLLHHDLTLNPDTARDAAGEWIGREARTPIRELTAAALRQYDVGRLRPGSKTAAEFPRQVACDGARIPLLSEYLAVMRGADAALNIELKSDPRKPRLTPPTDVYAALFTAELDAYPELHSRLFVQSFDWELMRALKALRPAWKIGMTTTWQATAAGAERARRLGADVLSCNHRMLRRGLVREVHAMGMEVYAWTANAAADVQRLLEWEVDAVITDYPSR